MFFELGNYHVLVVTVTLNIFVQYLVVCTLELLLHEVGQTAVNKSIIIIMAFLLIFYFEYGRHVARLRRPRCRAYAPTNNAASHDDFEKIKSWVSVPFLYGYEAPLL